MSETAGITEPRWLWPRSAYVHIPFCAHHCGYCDFAVVAGADHRIDLYLEALGCELATLGSPQPVETLFLGGGTPTHLDARQLRELFALLNRWLPREAGAEVSVEANPGTLDLDRVKTLADAGVNRISLGAQSFQAHVLRVLERDHGPADIERAVAGARTRIEQVAIDLIFGVPGQTLDDWRADLSRTLALEPDHVSTYGLTYEKGTRLWKQRDRGEVSALDEDLELAMYETAQDLLAGAGLICYEISNHARPGRECRHNLTYWANEAYFGFGMGAARYVRGRREINRRDLEGYIRSALSGESVTQQSEELDPLESARETMAIQLRRGHGTDRRAFERQTGFTLDSIAGRKIAHLKELGLLESLGDNVRLSRRGRCVADAVICDLLADRVEGCEPHGQPDTSPLTG